MDITIRVVWKGIADPNNPKNSKPLPVPKVHVQTGAGNWSISGKLSAAVDVKGETFTDKEGKQSSTLVTATLPAMPSGDFANVRSKPQDDNKKLLFSQALKINFTWPADARNTDTLTLGNRDKGSYPTFRAGTVFPK